MTTTTGAYLQVMQNLPRMQTMTANEPAVKTASAYYAANIGDATTIKSFVSNYRLLSYALQAYGLGDQINNTALITQVLEQGVTSSKALANTLPNQNWRAFAAAFSFASGSTSPASASAIQTTQSDYVEQQLEINQGQQDPGVQLALYFNRVAPTATTEYSILGDTNLLEVAQTIFGLPPETAGTNIDQQATTLSKLMPISDLQDPAKLQQLTERFTAMYDLNYGPNSGTGASLTVTGGDQSTQTSAASSILSGVITSNGQAIASALSVSGSSTAALFSNSLMTSLQTFRLGG